MPGTYTPTEDMDPEIKLFLAELNRRRTLSRHGNLAAQAESFWARKKHVKLQSQRVGMMESRLF